MRYCCLFTGQQVPPSTFRTYNKQQSALIGMQTVMLIIPVRSQNWRFCCPGNPKIHNQYFLYVTESLDLSDKYRQTRPISDGFRKNNVNYWAFREIRSIIPHL